MDSSIDDCGTVEYISNFVANLECRTIKQGMYRNWVDLPYKFRLYLYTNCCF
jgi:hypothetical protein